MVAPYAAGSSPAARTSAPAILIPVTNAIESLNAKLRRAVRTRGHFPTDEAAIKLLYLVLRQVAQTWKMPPREWCEAKTQFAIMFDDRFVKA
jgi:putative transposase